MAADRGETDGGRAARRGASVIVDSAGRAARQVSATGRRASTTGRRAGRAVWRGFRRVTHAQGAGESGLSRVIDLHLVDTLADTLIVTALANTIFFAVPSQQARGRVATSLLVTMVPFILLAPVIGPLLDRVRSGRRYALATTMVVRAFLAWVMAGAVSGASSETAFSLYPAAFGFLVCQKAYIVTRATALPRVLPRGGSLVAANSRISVAGVLAMTVGGGVGAGLTAWVGPSWTLRLAFAVFAAGTVLALALPATIDSAEGELAARMRSGARSGARSSSVGRADEVLEGHDGLAPQAPDSAASDSAASDSAAWDTAASDSPASDSPARPKRRPGWSIGAVVVLGLRANAALRAFTGFLTLFLAFRLRTEPLHGFSESASVVLVVVLAAVGGGIGTAAGSALRRIRPEQVVVLVLGVTAATAAWSALAYGPWAVGAVAFVAGSAQGLGKLCLDALIQREVPERVRTSAFARSETVLQLAWVIGGGIGLALPLSGAWGLGIAATGTAAMTGLSVASLTNPRRDHARAR